MRPWPHHGAGRRRHTLSSRRCPAQDTDATETVQDNIIYAFDLLRPASGGIFAGNQRVFAVIDAGFP